MVRQAKQTKEVAVITLRSIIERGSPILLVMHDEDDGSWQFLDGQEIRLDQALRVSLERIVQLDPSIQELADLPGGWQAWRESPNDPWQRSKVGGDWC